MSQRVSHVRAKPAGHTCLPAKKRDKQELQAAKRIQACMPSHRARFGGLEGLQVIHAYQQRSQTNKNCKRRRESKPACSLIERGLEVSKACRSYMPTSKEAKQTRTASGDENPSLHAVSSSAVWRSPNSSSLLKAPCPVQEHQSLQHEVAGRDLTSKPRARAGEKRHSPCPVQAHQSLEHELAERDLTPEPRSVWKPRGRRSLLEASDFPRTRQLYWKTRVWCKLSADYVYTRPSEGSPRTTTILENKSLKARALRGPPEGSPRTTFILQNISFEA